MDRALILLAQEKLGAGDLPVDPLARSFGGQSRGGECMLCSKPIEHGAMEIELVFPGSYDEERILKMHPNCHAAWLAVSRPLRSSTA